MFRKTTTVFQAPSKKRSTLKTKNSPQMIANSFLQVLTPFQKGGNHIVAELPTLKLFAIVGTLYAHYFHKGRVHSRNSGMKVLTHLPRVDSSTTSLWTVLLPIAGYLVIFIYFSLLILI